MPFNPAVLGNQLIVAGQKQNPRRPADEGGRSAARIAKVLTAGEQLDTSLGSIRTGVRSTRTLLGPVVTALQFIVNALNGVRITTSPRKPGGSLFPSSVGCVLLPVSRLEAPDHSRVLPHV